MSMPNRRKFSRIATVFSLFVFSTLVMPSCESDKRSAKDQPEMSKIVVLTFDDAVKSHRTFVAPMLKVYGFNATFFITYEWMDDTLNFMSWDQGKRI